MKIKIIFLIIFLIFLSSCTESDISFQTISQPSNLNSIGLFEVNISTVATVGDSGVGFFALKIPNEFDFINATYYKSDYSFTGSVIVYDLNGGAINSIESVWGTDVGYYTLGFSSIDTNPNMDAVGNILINIVLNATDIGNFNLSYAVGVADSDGIGTNAWYDISENNIITIIDPSFKSVIPMNSGQPFYTTTQNPNIDSSCLKDMKPGDTCDVTWEVVPNVIELGNNFEFFTFANSLNYSSFISQTESEHIFINITGPSPIVFLNSTFECDFGKGLTTCDNFVFNGSLDAIWIDCNVNVGNDNNVTVSLYNQEDDNYYFNETITSKTGEYFIYSPFLNIQDSGNFKFDYICHDDLGNSQSFNETDFVPFGTFNVSLILPNTNTSIQNGTFFNFTSKVECVSGECGNVEFNLKSTPMNSGSPFYTTTQNPNTNTACLQSMIAGNSCDVTWTVFANVSELNNNYEFFTFANSLNYSITETESEHIFINITLPILDLPIYISPTPKNHYRVSQDIIQFKFEGNSINNCSIEINNQNYSMNLNNNICEFNYTPEIRIYNILFKGYYNDNLSLEQRNISFFPTIENVQSVPFSNMFVLFVLIVLFFGSILK